MPNRRLASYLFLTHNARENVRFSEQSKEGVIRKPYPYLLYQLKNFLTNNILSWFVHNWHIKPRSPYPSRNIGQVYALHSLKNMESPVSICIAADWASSTIQSAFVGDCIRDLQPDYTVHIGDTYYTGFALFWAGLTVGFCNLICGVAVGINGSGAAPADAADGSLCVLLFLASLPSFVTAGFRATLRLALRNAD